MPASWLAPNWPAPSRVAAFCTSREGGSSVAPYDSLNLGLHVGDVPATVQSNRALLARASGARPVFLDQVHGTALCELGAATPDGTVADAASTALPLLACTIMVADCLPVLLCDPQGRRVAAAHAGWRGLAGQQGQGVLEVSVRHMLQATGEMPMVWLGPCIGPQAFEVGEEVRAAFVQAAPSAAACFKPTGITGHKWLADLAGLARLRLQALGVSEIHGNDSSVQWCTSSQPSVFFSHRRDRVSGRMAACIWLRG